MIVSSMFRLGSPSAIKFDPVETPFTKIQHSSPRLGHDESHVYRRPATGSRNTLTGPHVVPDAAHVHALAMGPPGTWKTLIGQHSSPATPVKHSVGARFPQIGSEFCGSGQTPPRPISPPASASSAVFCEYNDAPSPRGAA